MFNLRIAGIAGLAALAAPVHAAPFDPIRFFDGRTEGQGQVKVLLEGSHGVRVHGQGRVEADGALVLVQTVEEEGKAPRQRSWRIRQTRSGHYAGTLSDAAGPITGEVGADGRFHIRYRMKTGMDVEQWLTPAGPDTLRNSMTIKKFGFTVATLEETIRRAG